METTNQITQFNNLPEWVQNVICGEKSVEVNERIIEKFGLTEEQIDFLFNILRQLILKQLSLDQFLESLKPLNLDEEKIKELAIEIAKHRLIPIIDYLEVDIPVYIQKWGGNISEEELQELLKEGREEQKKISEVTLEESADKEEIEKIKQAAPPQRVFITTREIVEEVIKQLNLTFSDEAIANRFKNIALSFLNETRGDLEMRIVLKRPQDIGGMGCTEEVADKIIETLEAQKPRISAKGGSALGGKAEYKKEAPKPGLAEGLVMPHEMIPTMTKIQAAAMPPPPSFAPSFAEATEGKPEVKPATTEAQKETEAQKIATTETQNDSESQKISEIQRLQAEAQKIATTEAQNASEIQRLQEITGPEEITKVAEEVLAEIPTIKEETPPSFISPPESKVEKSPEIPPVEPISIHRPPLEPSQLTMEEIKVTPKIYGPIDELRSIKLEDWRRWGTPNEASQRIQDKINLLAEESLVKKAEGIKAWKESEVNQMYLDIGTESIDKGISVEEVIALRTKEGRPTLNRDEFDAVVESNQKLRF